jgi:glycosyltransferase involved in cell wall biosynthesis
VNDNTSAKSLRVLIGIPAYNEADNLPQLLDKLRGRYDVVVVDDGSDDETPEVARAHGAMVLRHIINLGQGAADITKYKFAIDQGYDVLIDMDADGQHDPSEIKVFLDRYDQGDCDIVQGSRILGTDYKEAPFFRRTFLPHYSWLLNKLTGYDLTDYMCGMKAYRVTALKKLRAVLENMIEPQYLAAEAFIRFSKENFRVVEVPINLKKRASGVSRKGLFRYGFGVLRAILRTFMDKRYRTN